MTGCELSGRIQALPIRDVIRMIRMSRRSGVLQLRNGARQGEIEFHLGEILRATTTSEYRDIGTVALELGLIGTDELQEAVAMQRATGGRMPLGRVLVSLGFVELEQLRKMLRLQVDQVVQDLLRISTGSFDFRPSFELPPDDITQDVSDVLIEASLRSTAVGLS
jgi:hypothetical protein